MANRNVTLETTTRKNGGPHLNSTEEQPGPTAAPCSPSQIPEIDLLRRENEMLKQQLSAQIDLLKAQLGQITDLTTQVRKISDKIDVLTLSQCDDAEVQIKHVVATTKSLVARSSSATTETETASSQTPNTTPVATGTKAMNVQQQTLARPTIRTTSLNTTNPFIGRKPISWAEVACTPSLSKLPTQVQTKFKKSMAALKAKDSHPPHPRPQLDLPLKPEQHVPLFNPSQPHHLSTLEVFLVDPLEHLRKPCSNVCPLGRCSAFPTLETAPARSSAIAR